MNIAIFASAFHPSLGGVEELCRQLAHEYRARGWSAWIVTNRWPRHLPAWELIEEIPVYRIPFRTPGAGLKSELSYLLTTKWVQREVAALIRERRPDVLHVQCAGGNAHYAALAARRLGVPLVVTLQGELSMDATQLFQRSEFARKSLRSGLRDADRVTACSKHTLKEAEEFYGKSLGSKSSVIPNGIRLGDYSGVVPWQHPRPYILGIGRHVIQKGFDVLLRAVDLLWKRRKWDGDLVLAGDGPERRALENLAEQLGIRSRVLFTGRVDRKQTTALFAGCELLVLPSRHEPFGIVNLEAMASGKAIVATRVGGVPEVVRHCETGWLVPPEDTEALANGIGRLLEECSLRARFAAEARERVTSYDWSCVADKYEEIYRSVIRSEIAA